MVVKAHSDTAAAEHGRLGGRDVGGGEVGGRRGVLVDVLGAETLGRGADGKLTAGADGAALAHGVHGGRGGSHEVHVRWSAAQVRIH